MRVYYPDFCKLAACFSLTSVDLPSTTTHLIAVIVTSQDHAYIENCKQEE